MGIATNLVNGAQALGMVVKILCLVSSFSDETKKRLKQQPGCAPRLSGRAQRPKYFNALDGLTMRFYTLF